MTCKPQLLLTLLVGLVACTPPAEQVPPVEAGDYQPAISAPSLQLGVCADGTASMPRDVVAAGLDAIAGAVRSLPVPAAAAGAAAQVPVPEFHLVLRQVSANSSASIGDQLIDVEVPGVPGLMAPPDPADYQTYAEDSQAWTAAQSRTVDARATATHARAVLLDALSTVAVVADGSEIAGCVTALRDSFPVGSEILTVIVSDLEQTGAPQLRGDYTGIHMIVAHFCPDSERCAQSEADWRSVFDQVGIASLTVVSIGQLADELANYLEVD